MTNLGFSKTCMQLYQGQFLSQAAFLFHTEARLGETAIEIIRAGQLSGRKHGMVRVRGRVGGCEGAWA